MSSFAKIFGNFLLTPIFGCDYDIILFKEPAVEKKPVPDAPKSTGAKVEQKVLPPSKGINGKNIFLVYLLYGV